MKTKQGRNLMLVQEHTIHYMSDSELPILPTSETRSDGLQVLQSTVVTGDTTKALTHMPSNFVQTVITSPPYFSLRDYSIPGQIGLEGDPDEYVASLVTVFEEVRRVLK